MRPVVQSGQRLRHQRRAALGQYVEEFRRGLLGPDGKRLLQQDRPGVESFFEQHGGVAGEGFAHGHGPLDRRGAAIARKQRRVQIDAAQPRQREHPGRNDAAISDHDDRIGRDRFKPRAKFLIVANLLRLDRLQGHRPMRRFLPAAPEFFCPAHGPVGLGDDQGDLCPAASSASSVGTAKRGVPQKTSFIGPTTRRRAASCGSCAGTARASARSCGR